MSDASFNTMADLEAALQRAEQACRAADEARRAAEAASRHKSEFLARMSHEIRTPLNGIIGMASLLAEEPLGDKARGFVATIGSSSQVLLSVINDVLDFSKVEAGQLELEAIEFSIASAVDGALELCAPLAAEKNLTLASCIDARVAPHVVGDLARVKQILINLVSNALKFTAEGSVTVRVAPGDTADEWAFSVEDTGVGIDEAVQPRIFQAFYQGDLSTTRQYGGSGLGLAICRRLVEMMNGSIGFDSVGGGGARFWFRCVLPAAREKAALAPAPARFLRAVVVTEDDALRAVLAAQLAALAVATEFAPRVAALACDAMRFEPLDAVFVVDARAATEDAEGETLAAGALKNAAKILLLDARTDAPARGPGPQAELRTHALAQSKLRAAFFQLETHQASAVDIASRRFDDKPLSLASAAPVLVVEDHPVNQMVAREMIERIGLAVDIAGSGVEALARLKRRDYAVVLMDCEMQGMDGFETTRRLRADGARGAKVPIVAMTAYAMNEDKQRCLAAGMDDYIAKPVTLGSLSQALGRWLPEARAASIARPQAPRPTANAMNPATPASAADDALLDLVVVDDVVSLDGGELFRDVLKLYFDSVVKHLEGMRRAARQGDERGVRELAHMIRGSSSNVGAAEMARCAWEIERLQRAPRSIEELEVGLIALEETFARTRARLRELAGLEDAT